MIRFSNLEFHRSGVGVLTHPNDADPGSAIYLENAAGSTRPLRFCSCTAGRRRTCQHLSELGRQLRTLRQTYRGRSPGDVYSTSTWYRLAQTLFEGEAEPFTDVEVAQLRVAEQTFFRFSTPSGEPLLDYLESSPASLRLLERLAKVPSGGGFLDRADLIDKLAVFLRSSEEQHLNRVGMRTNRQSFEASFWHRLCYHCFRELEDADGRFEPGVDLSTGVFTLSYVSTALGPILRFFVPRSRVVSLLTLLNEAAAEVGARKIVPATLEALLRTTSAEEPNQVALERLRAVLEYEDAPTPQVEKFLYGDLVYVPELERLAWLDGAEGSAGHRARRRPVATRVCGWEEPNPEVIQEPSLALEDPMRELRILREFDFVEIAEDEDNPDDLRVQYAFGEQRVSIQQIVQARLQGLPYLETETGWIDLAAPELRGLESFIRSDATTSETLSLSSAQILRLRSSTDKPVHVGGSRDRSQILRRLLNFQPSTPLGELEGMTSALRPYQKIGVEWLNFLYENELAGLLCDDMGLGKTHQAMALMLLLREQHGVDDPFLVICPRTVISHWRDKLAQHAPGLRVAVYHGTNRNLEESLEDRDVLVASYGVLRNDAAKLGTVSWSLLIFDEIQQIKNQETQAHRAAVTVAARMKIGLTGTPIENSLNELKNLFDLVLPGYLGDDESYFDRFGASSRDYPDDEALRDLRRLISPFVLRRLKTAVLDELPGKIEDIRTCSLSAEQHQLYRDAIDSRGLALADKIRRDDKPLPYIHIFALLNQLKQICDHPALALGEASEWREHDSQKWDLFQELLAESLESGQKVVVFSQYLGMIAMMESYLDELGIGYATLTGSTRRRGEVVDRFNTNPECRVFLGSLRAGGTGIDLIAGSVVIHYDRWWNAAKEDQATDRVYRIGQRRAVQVFKLVTEDTLEERIAAMIDRKRDLMSSVVQADHPQLGKIFTREELLELLRQVD